MPLHVLLGFFFCKSNVGIRLLSFSFGFLGGFFQNPAAFAFSLHFGIQQLPLPLEVARLQLQLPVRQLEIGHRFLGLLQLCLCPLLVTGGLHMDGFADTCDALASHAEPARKQEILKDSHVGAFALIRVCMYLVAQLALASALAWDKTAALCMALGYVLERCLSGWAVAALPLAKNTGLAHACATAADRTATARILAAAGGLSALALVCIGRIPGLAMAAAALVVLAWYRRLALREFGGLSGDLAGWFVQWCELAQLAVLVLTRALLSLL